MIMMVIQEEKKMIFGSVIPRSLLTGYHGSLLPLHSSFSRLAQLFFVFLFLSSRVTWEVIGLRLMAFWALGSLLFCLASTRPVLHIIPGEVPRGIAFLLSLAIRFPDKSVLSLTYQEIFNHSVAGMFNH